MVQNNSWESGKDVDVFFHPPALTFFSKGLSDDRGEHDGKVSMGGRTITNMQFADDIDALAEEVQELEAPVESLDLHTALNGDKG